MRKHRVINLGSRILAIVMAVMLAVPTSSLTAYAENEPANSEPILEQEEQSDPAVEENEHNIEYSDNGDGTHNEYCVDEDCDYTESEEHEYIDGVCVCGLVRVDEDADGTETDELEDTEVDEAETEEGESEKTDATDTTKLVTASKALEPLPQSTSEGSDDDTYTVDFNVWGIDKFTVVVTYDISIADADHDDLSEELSVVDGKASYTFTKQADMEAHLAIRGVYFNQLEGKPYDGNISCKKGDTYYQLYENEEYLFDLGVIEEDATFDFRCGFNEDECQEVTINIPDAEDNCVYFLDIMYSSNHFEDSIDSTTGIATRGEMRVTCADDKCVFWIPKDYDWVIVNISGSTVGYKDTQLLDQSGKNCLEPDEKIYYKPLKASHTRQEGDMQVYHRFEGSSESTATYTFQYRTLNTLTFVGDLFKKMEFKYYKSVEGTEWENYEYPSGYANENGELSVSAESGYKLAITKVDDMAIYTTPLLFSDDGDTYYEPTVETIKVSDELPEMQAYIIEIPDSDQTIYVKSDDKDFHIAEDNPVGYSIDFLSGIQEGQIYDNTSDITFKVSNVYGNTELPDVEVKYTEHAGWFYDAEGNLEYSLLESMNNLETAFTVTADENGVYSIDKQKLEVLSEQLFKNVTLYFSPVVECYNYDFRVADDTIKNADILVSKTKIDLTDTSKCAVVNMVYMDNDSIDYKVPKGYYVGLGEVESDDPDVVPAIEVVGGVGTDGFWVEYIFTSAILAPYDPDGSISLGVFNAAKLLGVGENLVTISDVKISSESENTYNIDFNYVISEGADVTSLSAILCGSDNMNAFVNEWTVIDTLSGDDLQIAESDIGEVKSGVFKEKCRFRPEKGIKTGYQYYIVRFVKTVTDTDPNTGIATETQTIVGKSDILDATGHKYGIAEDEDDSNYSGVVFIDEEGNKLDELVLHKGESKLVRIALVRKDTGAYEPLDSIEHTLDGHSWSLKDDLLSENNYWYYMWSTCEYDEEKDDLKDNYWYSHSYYINANKINASDSPTDCSIKLAWTKEYILGLSNYITGTEVTPEGTYNYVKYHVESGDIGFTMFGKHTIVLPVKVIEADSQGTYDEPENLTVYDESISDKQTCQEIRKSMVARENMYYGFILKGDDPLADADPYIYDIWDFVAEREGMEPNEGDYLHWTMGSRNSLGFVESYEYEKTSMKYYGEKYTMYSYSLPLVTTAYEEQLVDEKIAGLIAEGGALHAAYESYQSNPDADGAKTEALRAIFNWITANVSGTVKGQKSNRYERMTPIYHTAYSALFINNGYDSKQGSGTCQAFALLFTRLTREFGIPSKVIMGIDAEAHTYNIAQFEDGWYYVDASAGKFKKDYDSFSKAEERGEFSNYYFVKNYKQKIKGFVKGDVVFEIMDENGNLLYRATDFEDAASFIEDSRKTQEEESLDLSRYIIKLIKDTTWKNYGGYNAPLFDEFYVPGGYDDVSIDLGGHTLTIPECRAAGEWEEYGGEVYLAASKVTNGTIVVGKNVALNLSGANIDSTDYYQCSNLTVKGAGTLELSGNLECDSSLNVNDIGVLSVDSGVVLNGDIKVKKLILNSFAYGSTNAITFNGNVETQYFYAAVNEEKNVYINNLTVTKASKICQGSKFVIRNKISFNGRTYVGNYLDPIKDNQWTSCEDIGYHNYYCDYLPVIFMLARDGNEKLGTDRLVINGIIDASNTSANIRVNENVLPILIEPAIRKETDGVITYEEDVFRLGDTIGIFSNSSFYLSQLSTDGENNIDVSKLTAQKLTVDNIEQFIEIPREESVGELDYYNDILYLTTRNITVSLINEDESVIKEIGSFARWDSAIKHINSLNNNAVHYLITLSDDINAMGSLTMPASASSVTIRSKKTEEVAEEEPSIEPVTFRYVGDFNFNTNVTFENVNLIGQTYNSTSKEYKDGYRSAVKLGAKALTLDGSSMNIASLTGISASSLVLVNGASLDATKDVTGITTLEMSDSTLRGAAKLNFANVISNSTQNKIIYGGNSTGNILTITDRVTGDDLAYRTLDESEYGANVRIRNNAIILCPETLNVTDPVTNKPVARPFDQLSAEEKENQNLVNASVATADWFIVGEAGNDFAPTYKSGTVIRYGQIKSNVVLLMSTDEGANYEVEGGYDTLAEAFARIKVLAAADHYYKVEISSSADLATDKSGATSSALNPTFPDKLKKLTICSTLPNTVLNIKDNLTIKSDVEMVGITLKSAKPATLNLGNYELTLNGCNFEDSNGNTAVNSVNGGSITGGSALILDHTALQTTAKLDKVGSVIVENSTETFGDFASHMLINGTMNIGTLEIGEGQIVETRGAATITNITNKGGTLITSATVTKVQKATATDVVGQISKVTPMLTVNGLVKNIANDNRPLILKLTQKVKRDNQYVYEVIDFGDTIIPEMGRMTDALRSSGVWLAKASKVSADTVVLSEDNQPADGILVKTGGYLAYRRCEANAVLKYTDENGVFVESKFATLSEAIAEINSIKTKRDYVIELTDAATLPVSVQVGDNTLYKAPAAFKMPTAAYVDSLTIRPKDETGAKIYFSGAITFTSNIILRNIDFVQMVKSGSYYNCAELVSQYPGATSVSTGGKALTLVGTVTFNTPVNLAGGNKGSLTFADDATITTYTNGSNSESNEIYGSVSGFSTMNITEDISVLKYRTKATAGLTGGGLQAAYVLVNGSKNPILTVEGNYSATNTVMACGDIVIKDKFDSVTKKYQGAKAEFTNLTITGSDMLPASDPNTDRITITADRDFNIKGTLTSTTGLAKLVTRQKYNATVSKRTPYLNISGTVLINDYGNNSAENLGDRIEVEVLQSNECWDTEYAAVKGIDIGSSSDADAVCLEGSPANTGMVFTTSKGTVDQFRLSPANIDAGRNVNRYDAENTDGYILKKISGKIYAYFGDEIQVAVVRNGGEDGKLSSVPSETVLGFYPAFADAVAAVDALKDKSSSYTLILMNDLGVKENGEAYVYAPISLNLPAYAKEVTVTSYASDEFTGKKAIFFSNKISLKTRTTFSNVYLNGVTVKNKLPYGALQDISAGGSDLVLKDVEFGGALAAGLNNSSTIGIKNITGNGKNTLTLSSDEIILAGGVTDFAKVELTNSANARIGGALKTSVLSFGLDEELTVKGAVTVTDIENNKGTLQYYKDETSRKTNLTVKGNINNEAPDKLKLVVNLAAPAKKWTQYESLSDVLLTMVNNKVDLAGTRALANMDKAALDTFTITISENPVKDGAARRDFDIDNGLIKANNAVYAYDDSGVANSMVKLTYAVGENQYSVKCLDMTQAAREIEAINNPTISYEIILPEDVEDTDVTSDTAQVSALKLPAAGKAKELIIKSETEEQIRLRYTGNISYAGKLTLRNIMLNPVKIAKAGIVPADTAISSTASVVKINGAKETFQGLTLDNVKTKPEQDGNGNPIGLISKITGSNKVTDVSISNSDLKIKEGINSIHDLYLCDTDLTTGKTSSVMDLYLSDGAEENDGFTHFWNMLGATGIENIHCGSTDTYLAATQTTKKAPNLTLKGKVYGDNKVYIALLKAGSSLSDVQPYDVYSEAAEGQTSIKNANLITAKFENADRFMAYVPGDTADISGWVTYKDNAGYVKAAPEGDLKVRIEQYYENPEEYSTTYATCMSDAVKVIDAMNDKTAGYRVYLEEDCKTGTLTSDGTENYAGFITPVNAKLVTYIGDGEGITISYTGSITTKCNVAFENIIFDEGTYNSKTKVFKSNWVLSLSTGNFDVSFDEKCGYVRNDELNEQKYGSEATYVDLLFGKIKTGSYKADSAGVTFESYVYCASDIAMKNVTLEKGAKLLAGGKISISGNTYIGNGESEIEPGIGKSLTLNNIIGKSPAVLDLNYYFSNNEVYLNSTTLLTINGNIESGGEGEALKVNLRPYLNEKKNQYKCAEMEDIIFLAVYDVDFSGLSSGQKFANIPNASAETINIQYLEDNDWDDADDIYYRFEHYYVTKHNKGLYVMRNIDNEVCVEGYTDEAYSNKVYSSEFVSVDDAVREIDNLNRKDRYYKITLTNGYYHGMSKLPTKAKEVTIKDISSLQGHLLFFPGSSLTLGCDTVLDGITLQAGVSDFYNLSYNTKSYEIKLGQYSLTEKNTPGVDIFTEISQNGLRTKISGSKGSSYTIAYSEIPRLEENDANSVNYLSLPTNQISGITDVNIVNETEKPLTFTIDKDVTGITNLNITGNETGKIEVCVKGAVSVINTSINNATLKAANTTVSKVAFVENAVIYAGTSDSSDGRIKLGDIVVNGGQNVIDGKQSKTGSSQIEITGSVSKGEECGDDGEIKVGLRYNSNNHYVILCDGLLLATAPKCSTGWFKLHDDMSPEMAGSGIYKSGKYIRYGVSGGNDAEVTLTYGDHVTRLTSFEEAVSEIDSLGLYVDPKAKVKTYLDYTISLNDDVAIETANGSYTTMKLPAKVGVLTIEGNAHEMRFSGNIQLKTNTVFKNVTLVSASAGSAGTGVSMGNYALTFDHVNTLNSEEDAGDEALFSSLSGSAKGTFTLASGRLSFDKISGIGRINVGANSRLDVNINATMNRIYLQNGSVLGVAGSLKAACVYVDTNDSGKAVIEQSEGSLINLTGETVFVDGVRKTVSISGTEAGRIPVLNVAEKYDVQAGTRIMIDNCAMDSKDKIKLYKNDIVDGNELSFYIDGKNIYSGR